MLATSSAAAGWSFCLAISLHVLVVWSDCHVPDCVKPSQLHLLHPHAEVFLIWVWEDRVLWIPWVECYQPCHSPTLHLLQVPLICCPGGYLELCIQASGVTNHWMIIPTGSLFSILNTDFHIFHFFLILVFSPFSSFSLNKIINVDCRDYNNSNSYFVSSHSVAFSLPSVYFPDTLC